MPRIVKGLAMGWKFITSGPEPKPIYKVPVELLLILICKLIVIPSASLLPNLLLHVSLAVMKFSVSILSCQDILAIVQRSYP